MSLLKVKTVSPEALVVTEVELVISEPSFIIVKSAFDTPLTGKVQVLDL